MGMVSGSDYTINVTYEQPYPVDEASLQEAAWHALNAGRAGAPCALTVTLTSAGRVQELNREYAGLDEPTDVLSFAAEDQPYAVEPGEPPYLGDVVIAVPVAEEQARELGHSLLAELQMLVIHGTLHLLGYDHGTPEEQAEMWAFESAARDAVRAGSSG